MTGNAFRRPFVAVGLAAAMAVAALPLSASLEDPAAIIERALASTRAGDNGAAIELLQKAIQELQRSTEAGLESFLPATLKGWSSTSEKPTSGSFNSGGQTFQWNQVQRSYTKDGAKTRVNVTITNMPQMVQGQRQAAKMFTNPDMLKMMNQDPSKKIEIVNEAGWTGWKQVDSGRRAQIVIIGDALMIICDVNEPDEAALDLHVKGIDLARLKTQDRAASTR